VPVPIVSSLWASAQLGLVVREASTGMDISQDLAPARAITEAGLRIHGRHWGSPTWIENCQGPGIGTDMDWLTKVTSTEH
jgi:hypothetical protein